jgi:hypothetical protein
VICPGLVSYVECYKAIINFIVRAGYVIGSYFSFRFCFVLLSVLFAYV